MNGKQISDDEFFHIVNVSFAVVTDLVKTTQSQMLSLGPDRENGRQFSMNIPKIHLCFSFFFLAVKNKIK